ncbi:hypothetical protein [Amycolatopsis japonica]
MSIQEEAERLRAIASSESIPVGVLLAAQQSLDSVLEQTMAVLGMQAQSFGNIAGFIGAAKQAIDSGITACQAVETAIHDAADYHARG